MNKKQYIKYTSTLQQMIFDFVEKYNITSNCSFPQSKSDDFKWTLDLGELYGKVNILIESWYNASEKSKVTTLSIPMKFITYRDKENLFNCKFGHVNPTNGLFLLNAKENASESLKNAFKDILELFAYGKQTENNETLSKFGMMEINLN